MNFWTPQTGKMGTEYLDKMKLLALVYDVMKGR